jgi:hypothetical protein
MVGRPGKVRVGRDRPALARHPHPLSFDPTFQVTASVMLLEEGIQGTE